MCSSDLIVVTNTPGVLTETTADTAFLLILAARRLASEAEADLRGGRWTGWALDDHLSLDVHGATLGLVGFGRIGRAVARRAEAFGMEVLHHTRTDTGLPGWTADLDHLVARVDILSLHVPLTASTQPARPAARHSRRRVVGSGSANASTTARTPRWRRRRAIAGRLHPGAPRAGRRREIGRAHV